MDVEKRIDEVEQVFELIQDNYEPRDTVLVCRNVLEKVIELIFDYKDVKQPVNASLLELLNNTVVQNFFETDVIIDSLHFVRILGINALHEKHIKKTQANVAYEHIKYLIVFIKEKMSSNISLNASTQFHQYMSEAKTRKEYIDLYLNEAGWEVIEPNSKTQLSDGKFVKSGTIIPGKACCEIPVKGMNNLSGIGFCDYVLYGKDGKPLAIIEAKRSSVEAGVGQQQVREYGECMKKEYGYVPVLYYTNGYDINVVDGSYPSRRVAAFHTIDELSYLIQKRNMHKIIDFKVDDNIAGRYYQKMAITTICERFNNMYRKGLIVMATGTGKTRTAIALVDILTRNNFVKNVLFLADRTSLVRQAFKNFQKLLPDITYSVLSDKALANEPNARITFSTHQTMINLIDKDDKEFNIGRFDLIIIDEAHRSIFNKYGAIFSYFDSLLIGLTATPKDEVDANTYRLFNCESGIPNYSYSMEEAVRDQYLVPYRLVNRTTKVLKEGIRFGDLSEKDRAEINLISENDYKDDSIIKGSKIFKKIFNKDTCRKVLDDLMTIGLKVELGQKIGKTIIFAVNHYHAQLIVDTFNEMYPMYPNYCKLIDNQVKNSEHLIEEFETNESFRIAVSVDMLDTGIDVPSVLNLVFFKKVNSTIKLIQMIGRGTRLCPKLIDGKDKNYFYILDYFNNLKEFADDNVKQPVSINQKLFEVRLDIMCLLQTTEHQLNNEHKEYYNEIKTILMTAIKNIKKYGSTKIGVREVMGTVDKYCNDLAWNHISKLEQKEILYSLKPLIINDIKENYLNLSFDYIMLQIEKMKLQENDLEKAGFLIKKVRIISQILLNKASINEILQREKELSELYSEEFWTETSISDIEVHRKRVRHLMKYLKDEETGYDKALIDFLDETQEGDYIDTPLIDIRTYKEKVMDYLFDHSNNPTILKIKNLEQLSMSDFDYLEEILWVKLGNKDDYYAISKIDNLAVFIRSLVGVNQEAINKKLSKCFNDNVLTSEQQEFIYSIINYVRENGDVKVETLIEPPFDHVDLLGLFGTNVPIVREIVNTFHNCVVVN